VLGLGEGEGGMTPSWGWVVGHNRTTSILHGDFESTTWAPSTLLVPVDDPQRRDRMSLKRNRGPRDDLMLFINVSAVVMCAMASG